MAKSMGEACDVVITPSHGVYINGHKIGMVSEVQFEVDGSGLDVMTVRVLPTSVVYGDPPKTSVSAEYDDADGMPRVDIRKAIKQAKERMHKTGLADIEYDGTVTPADP